MSVVPKILAAVAFLLAAAVPAAAVLAGLPPLGDGWLRWILALPAVAIVGTIIALAHALGHVLGGAVAGFRLARLAAGLLLVERSGDALRMRVTLAPASVRFEPQDHDELRRRWLVTVLCGPAISLMFGAQCLAFWLATSSMLLAGNASILVRAISAALILAGIGSLAYGIIALLPLRIGALRTDGWTTLRLLRKDADVMRDVAHYIHA